MNLTPYRLTSVLMLMLLLCACYTDPEVNIPSENLSNTTPEESAPEIIYHVMPRSFYDSDGDLHGDLAGVEARLDYLQSLGVTSILMTPLYPSIYYHNYFADSFEGIDAEYGDMQDFRSLMLAVHRRNMRFYMDMEIHYVTEHHDWYQGSFGHPESDFADYVLYRDGANLEPETMIFNLSRLQSYDGEVARVTTVDLRNPAVKDYFNQQFLLWLDPNQDGDFSDGVDGFRIDHMMDDLDAKGILTGLFTSFWSPLIDKVRSRNPNVVFMAEQADWKDEGLAYFQQSDVDKVFAFNLRDSFISLDGNLIQQAIKKTLSFTPYGKDQITFLENHDIHRSFSFYDENPGKARAAATLLMTFPGTPSVYYGQELGMRGSKEGDGHGGFNWAAVTGFWTFVTDGLFSDGQDIIKREAFEWYADPTRPGMTLWYKNTQWWDGSVLQANDGISVEEQQGDSDSLLELYRKLMNLRKSNKPLYLGDIHFAPSSNKERLIYTRTWQQKTILVAVNLSAHEQIIDIDGDLKSLFKRSVYRQENTLRLEPYGISIWQVNK